MNIHLYAKIKEDKRRYTTFCLSNQRIQSSPNTFVQGHKTEKEEKVLGFMYTKEIVEEVLHGRKNNLMRR